MHALARAVTAALLLGSPGPVLLAPALAEAGARPPAVAVSDCWPTDNGDPVLTALSVSPAVVDVTNGPGRVTFRAAAEDTGGPGALTGVRRIQVAYGRTATERLRGTALTRDANGTWSGSLPFYPGGGTAGPRMVTFVSVVDWAGNERSWGHAELVAAGFTTDFALVAPVPDTSKPVIRSLSVSRQSVDLRTGQRTVVFRARLTDDLAGVTEASVWLEGASEDVVALHRVAGSRLDGTWQGRLTMSPWAPGGRRLLMLEVWDGRSRLLLLHAAGLDRRHLPWRIRVIPRAELDAPVVRRATVTPTAVDVRSTGASIHVVVQAGDATSGIGEVRARLTGPEYVGFAPNVRLHRTAGTSTAGRWEGEIPLSRCTSPAGTWSLSLQVYDRAGHWAPEVTGVEVQVQALDHIRPEAEVGGASTPDDPLTLRFSEDVTNLDPADAQVWGGLEGAPELQVAGTWRCRDVAAAETDCATGLVRFATFVPAQPWPVDGYFRPELSPSGAVGVRDPAGNPVDTSQAGGVHVPKP